MVAGGFGCGRSGSIGSLTIEDCQFIGNSAVESGGAISLETVFPMREAILRRCTFVGNSAEFAAAVMTSTVNPTYEHCTFAGNASAHGYGTLDLFGPEAPVLRNCILAFSSSGAAIRCHDSATATLICCDVFGNADGDWVGCIAGQEGQNGNFALDPLLCDFEGGDLDLQDGSPCAPDYNPDCGLIGALPVGCEPTPVEETSWGAMKALYR
jgi:predicted outer membrane repeat protein